VLYVNWQNDSLAVCRLVFGRADGPALGASVRLLASRAGLLTADESATPTPGDFWLGCSPLAGWGTADPAAVGWVCFVEVPLALALLRVTADIGPAEPATSDVFDLRRLSAALVIWN